MLTKNLYIVICDSGDGSNSLGYTFDSELINELNENQHLLDDSYQSGDGLQVCQLTVPADSTYVSLGISQYSVINREEFDFLYEEEDEE